MNTDIRRALGPVRRRIRRNRFLRGAAAGLAAGLGAASLLQAVSFFVPVPDRGIQAAAVCGTVLLATAAASALRPVKNTAAAKAADACGLQERAVTALEFIRQETAADDAYTSICMLQRRDACAALEKLDVKMIRPGSVKKALSAAIACAVLLGCLLLVPNPQDAETAVRKALSRTLQEGREAISRAAEADEAELQEGRKAELRKIAEDLNRDLSGSRDAADALIALDRAEQRLEQWRQQTAGESAAAADGESGFMDGQAGENTTSETETSLQTAAQAGSGQQGEISAGMKAGVSQMQIMQALTELKTAVNPSAQPGTGFQQGDGMQGVQAGRTGQDNLNGSGTGAVNTGRKAGGGAGEGSTNEEESGGKNSGGSHTAGTREPRFREAEYETIYDPERIDKPRQDVMTEQDRLSEGDSVQTETGPGPGSLSGDVPWSEVLQDYADTEARAADRENLTVRERQWVTEYFRKLTERQN